MRTFSSPPDVRLADLAARQYGVVSRRQLLALGLTPSAVTRRLAAGRLHLLHAGVYAVGHTVLSGHARWLAAVFAAGPGALLSHRSAAALWGFRRSSSPRIELTTSEGRTRRLGTISIHRTRTLHPDDRAEHERIAVTSVARTLVDLASLLPRPRLRTTLEEAERLRLLDLRTLEAACDRGKGRKGVAALRAAIEEQCGPPAITKSELEALFVEICREAGVPLPIMNAMVVGLEVDAYWPKHALVVEIDGYAFHHDRASFERDRERDARLLRAGLRVLRLTHRRMHEERHEVIADLQALLAAAVPAADGSRGPTPNTAE